jgi:hypothetical protein
MMGEIAKRGLGSMIGQTVGWAKITQSFFDCI